MSVYGQTKAAGDHIVSTAPRHYILRSSWVIGDGRNFVRTMLSLAHRDIDPAVVDDQYGRLTFAPEIAKAIRRLLEIDAPYGIYNVTGGGPATSWAYIARQVFSAAGHEPERITAVSTANYFASTTGPVAPRPRNSLLDLSKITGTGFVPTDAVETLKEYATQAASSPS